MQPVCLHMIFLLFTLLYLIFCFKISLLIILKKPSIEKALLTLHITAETHFFTSEKTKVIMHGLGTTYVMR